MGWIQTKLAVSIADPPRPPRHPSASPIPQEQHFMEAAVEEGKFHSAIEKIRLNPTQCAYTAY